MMTNRTGPLHMLRQHPCTPPSLRANAARRAWCRIARSDRLVRAPRRDPRFDSTMGWAHCAHTCAPRGFMCWHLAQHVGGPACAARLLAGGGDETLTTARPSAFVPVGIIGLGVGDGASTSGGNGGWFNCFCTTPKQSASTPRGAGLGCRTVGKAVIAGPTHHQVPALTPSPTPPCAVETLARRR